MIHRAHNAPCPLGQHGLSARYQSAACSRDYWGLWEERGGEEREREREKKKASATQQVPIHSQLC